MTSRSGSSLDNTSYRNSSRRIQVHLEGASFTNGPLRTIMIYAADNRFRSRVASYVILAVFLITSCAHLLVVVFANFFDEVNACFGRTDCFFQREVRQGAKAVDFAV